jgi:tetratricopeptide (TPR) repeat protein
MNKLQPLVVLSILLATANPMAMAVPDAASLQIQQKSLQWMKWQSQAMRLTDEGKYEQAEKIWKQLIADREQSCLDLNSERSGLALTYLKWGKLDQADALYKINVLQREQLDGPKSYSLMYCLNEYAQFLASQGRADEAKKYKDRADELERTAEQEGDRLLAAQKRQAAAHHHKRLSSPRKSEL